MKMDRAPSIHGAFALLLVGRLASALLQAALLVLLARQTEPNVFGAVAAFVAVITVAGAVADLGLETTALRQGAMDLSTIGAMRRLHTGLVGSACLVMLVACALGLLLGEDLLPLMPLVLWVFLERRLSFDVGLNIASHRTSRAAAALACSRSLAVGLFLLVPLVDSPVLMYSLSLVVGSSAGVAIARVDLPPANATEVARRQILKTANPFWRASMSGLLRTLDVPIVQAVCGQAVSGIYALPSRAIAPMRLIATSMSTTALPYAARQDFARLRTLERTMLAALFATVLFATITWAYVDEVVVMVLGGAYEPSADVLRVLTVGVILNVPGAFWSGILQGTGREQYVARVGSILFVAFLPFVVVGAALGGAVGAAVGVSATYLMQAAIFGFQRVRAGTW